MVRAALAGAVPHGDGGGTLGDRAGGSCGCSSSGGAGAWRRSWSTTPLQVGIILTANYAFLNYLVLLLGVLLLDDRHLARARAPRRGRSAAAARRAGGWPPPAPCSPGSPRRRSPPSSARLPGPLGWPAKSLAPFRIANAYGLFAVMTRGRYEVEFQGTLDGEHWVPYPFRFKPQDPDEAPGIYAPYQPRFEWNLWFASLAPWYQNPWVVDTERRLLAASPRCSPSSATTRSTAAPHAVRTVLWQYWFTDRETQRETGAWWRRSLVGPFAPPVEAPRDLPE